MVNQQIAMVQLFHLCNFMWLIVQFKWLHKSKHVIFLTKQSERGLVFCFKDFVRRPEYKPEYTHLT